jgi:hypothetical protein
LTGCTIGKLANGNLGSGAYITINDGKISDFVASDNATINSPSGATA